MIKLETWGSLESLSAKAAYLDAFFCCLKKVVQPEEYPIFFTELHIDGEVPAEKVQALLTEVKDLEAKLKTISVDAKLLDDPDFQATPDLHTRYLNSAATNIAEWFQTQQRLNMLETLKYYVDYANRKKAPIYIRYYLL
jgi:hypothetical protein